MKNEKFAGLIKMLLLLLLMNSFYTVIKAQTVVKLFPTSSIRLDVGKTKTLMAPVYVNGQPNPNLIPTFSIVGNSSIVALEINEQSPLGVRIKGLNAGTTSIKATYNGIESNLTTITVNNPSQTPTAIASGDWNSNGISVKAGEPIEVDASGSQGVSKIIWNWGDGDTSNDVLSATHSYLSPGTYNLMLTIKNSSGSAAPVLSTTVTVTSHSAQSSATVTSMAQLRQEYLNCKEEIIIPAGTTLIATNETDATLPIRSCSNYVTIRSSGTMPNIQNRINPTTNASSLATIKGRLYYIPALLIGNGASKIRFVGIKFESSDDQTISENQTTIVEIGRDQTSPSDNPSKIIFEHCVINPPDSRNVRHGILNDGYKVAMISSWFGNIKMPVNTTDSQAVYTVNGRGAHVYNNTFLEASSENVIYGGGHSLDDLVTRNIEFRRCFFDKRLSWNTTPATYTVKNIFEIKNARQMYIEGCVFEHHWVSGQSFAIVFSSTVLSSPSEPPGFWVICEDIVMENSRVSHVQGGLSFVLMNGQQGGGDPRFVGLKPNNIIIRNVLFEDITDLIINNNPTGNGIFAQAGAVDDIQLDHVTAFSAFNSLSFTGAHQTFRFSLKNSIIGLNGYGIVASVPSSIFGENALKEATSYPETPTQGTWTLSKNVFPVIDSLQQINPSIYPNGGNSCNTLPNPFTNCYPVDRPNFPSVGFTNYAGGNYQLLPSSIYTNQASDATNPGANYPVISARTSCTVSGNCGTTPTQTPYPGPNTPSILGTIIEVENFDNGGQGIAYNEIELSGETGSSIYRSNPVETVDIISNSNASNGFAVNTARAGEWLEYTVNVPSAGLYNFAVKYSSGYAQSFAQGKFRLEVCEPTTAGGVTNCVISTDVTVHSTGGWSNFNIVKAPLYLPVSGTRILRLVMVSNAPGDTNCNCVVANFDSITASNQRTLFDYDNDRKADVSVFRPSNLNWYLQQSTNGFFQLQFGSSGDTMAPADYDGDGKTDIAIYRPSSGQWWIRKSSDSSVIAYQFGAASDLTVQGDYTGDGKADVAFWRPSTGEWFILRSEDLSFYAAPFGTSGDIPAPGDYDGDGKFDLAVFRPSTATWYIQQSTAGTLITQFGATGDKVTPADYDGDGKTDIAVWRPSTGVWYIRNSSGGPLTVLGYGQTNDVPVPADYDGDGKASIAVWRPSNGRWYINNAGEILFGSSGDIPTPSTYVR